MVFKRSATTRGAGRHAGFGSTAKVFAAQTARRVASLSGPVALSAVMLCSVAAFASSERVPGLDLLLDPPDGFTPATTFAGFQQIQTFSTIEVTELAVPVNEAIANLDDRGLPSVNSKGETRQVLRIGSREAVLVSREVSIARVEFNQWVLVVGDALRTLIITASYPRWADDAIAESLKAALLTADWQRSERQQWLHDLPFTVNPSADLEFARRTPDTIVLADVSKVTNSISELPILSIGYFNSETELIDIVAISHRQLQEREDIVSIEILEESETRVDGIRAYAISASAQLRAGGSRVVVNQVLVFQQYRYLVFQGTVDASAADKYLPQFSGILDSIKFR